MRIPLRLCLVWRRAPLGSVSRACGRQADAQRRTVQVERCSSTIQYHPTEIRSVEKSFSSPSVFQPSFYSLFPPLFPFLSRTGIRGHKVLKAKTFCCWRHTFSLTSDGQPHFFASAANWCQLLLLIACGPCHGAYGRGPLTALLSSPVTLLLSVTPLSRYVSVTLLQCLRRERFCGVENNPPAVTGRRGAVPCDVEFAYVTSSPGQPSRREFIIMLFSKCSCRWLLIHRCHFVSEFRVRSALQL